MKICKKILSNGKKIKKECENYNIKFIDTSRNREEFLNDILNEIELKLYNNNSNQ